MINLLRCSKTLYYYLCLLHISLLTRKGSSSQPLPPILAFLFLQKQPSNSSKLKSTHAYFIYLKPLASYVCVSDHSESNHRSNALPRFITFRRTPCKHLDLYHRLSLLFYCFAFGYHDICQSHSPTDDTTSLNRCVKVAFISRSFTYTALISLLLPVSFQPLVFLIWVVLLFVYFNRKKISELGENFGSYLYDMWRRTKIIASNLYDRWRRTQDGNVPEISLTRV